MKRVFFVVLLCFFSASPALAQEPGTCLVNAARQQIGVTLIYDPAYSHLRYPNGDVSPERGVCTDVLIRAYRVFGVDLQSLVHEDMAISWARYPKLWGLTRPDSNIDHRRVPNLQTFFAAHGQKLRPTRDTAAYKPGDIVTWQLASGVPHIGLVSDKRSYAGTPLVIHNIGAGTREEDVLFSYEITGHYRYSPTMLRGACADAQEPSRSISDRFRSTPQR
ncbi:MAG TPA: DUF1287 domain-containing protein [Burkholderiales bacterium]|nr:DUF1287 domain-containing protein [Burkholderiales bacterium]